VHKVPDLLSGTGLRITMSLGLGYPAPGKFVLSGQQCKDPAWCGVFLVLHAGTLLADGLITRMSGRSGSR